MQETAFLLYVFQNKKFVTFQNTYSAYFFYGGGPYHKETSLSIFRVNERTGFYTIGSSVIKELMLERYSSYSLEMSKLFLYFKVSITTPKASD